MIKCKRPRNLNEGTGYPSLKFEKVTRYQAYQHNFTASGREGWLAETEIEAKNTTVYVLFLAVEGVLQVHVETGLLVECTIKLRKNGNFKNVAKQVYQSLADVLKDNDADWDYIVDDAVGVLSKYGETEVIDP